MLSDARRISGGEAELVKAIGQRSKPNRRK
ncbi:hypothetical protein TOPH_06249 [Tolypocladium ophioglossoides CBS 100239]|uniref:Uncharacterized protein n=1 Tax=Tolypocladium ophioglossoides (strain CBS 100239) TaxID=1163406 RepID=A0A0L0N4N5_TOLOC|nr:hypothetical protein TOPH_06249 [Tolypocladium ophioglossoides CBS 100239]